MAIRLCFRVIVCLMCSVCLYGQNTDSGFDFEKAEKALETVMHQPIEDQDTREQCSTIASYVGVYQFTSQRYDDAIRSLKYAIKNARKENNQMQILNHIFLVHSLCLTNRNEALDVLKNLVPLLQEMQANTTRGNFPVEYANGMRDAMNNLLLPLTSLVSKTFPDQRTLEYCFNLMLYLKQFAFQQLGNTFQQYEDKTQGDIKYDLYANYKDAICRQLRTDEVAIEFAPFINIDGTKAKGTSYVAYVLNNSGNIKFVEVCRKEDVERLYMQNESPWMLYANGGTALRSIIWDKLETFLFNKKKIFLSPCGILNKVNFLLFNSQVYEFTSTTELIKSYGNPNIHNVLLIGDVDYDNSIASLNRGDRDWGELSGTKKEIECIDKCLRPYYTITKLTKSSVTEQRVRECCSKAPHILHFATHAICYTDSVQRSQYAYYDFPFTFNPIKLELTYTGLVLSGGNNGFRRTDNLPLNNDGILLAEEISKLNLHGTFLVVLSACDSGNGVFDDIEGTLGLVKAFKIAGAKSIIASLSKVNDDATSEMMSEFYNRIAKKEEIHSAFVNTINSMKKKYPDTPKNWVSFKLIDCSC